MLTEWVRRTPVRKLIIITLTDSNVFGIVNMSVKIITMTNNGKNSQNARKTADSKEKMEQYFTSPIQRYFEI
jgi:hypothetical protein